MITLRKITHIALCTVVISMLKWFKISFLVGTPMAAFSLAHCLTPLIGLLTGGVGAVLLFFIRTVIRVYSQSALTNLALTCHLPTFSAALYLSALNRTQYTISLGKRLVLAAIPAICMLLFCSHSVGSQAWAYSLFWLIPMITLLVPHTSLVAHMLGSTFIAHAVGSVRLLYVMPGMTADMWLALIPVVMVERALFVAGMYMSYLAIAKLPNMVDTFKKALPSAPFLSSKEQ